MCLRLANAVALVLKVIEIFIGLFVIPKMPQIIAEQGLHRVFLGDAKILGRF
jgi:hypothetical protein